MNKDAANTGDTIVHYACGSGTLFFRKRPNTAGETRSDALGVRRFQIEMNLNKEKCFLIFTRQKGTKILYDEPRLELCIRSYLKPSIKRLPI